MMTSIQNSGRWRNRITGYGDEDPAQLLAHPMNFRVHGQAQRDAIAASLDAIGWIRRVMVNERTGRVLNGHARIDLAMSRGERVPVVYVDLNDDEELLVLSTYDEIAALAEADKDALSRLLDAAAPGHDALVAVLEDVREQHFMSAAYMQPQESDAHYRENPFESREAPASVRDGSDSVSSLKVLRLYLAADDYERVIDALKTLARHWDTETLAETIVRVVDDRRAAMAQ